MPAGDLIVDDYQVEWDATLHGRGTPYGIGKPGITGLGVPATKTTDVNLDGAPGAYGGRDYPGVRVITIPFHIEAEPAAAGIHFRNLATLWVPTPDDRELHIRLPGFGHIKVSGRPRGFFDDLSLMSIGIIEAFATFWCGDPTITDVP